MGLGYLAPLLAAAVAVGGLAAPVSAQDDPDGRGQLLERQILEVRPSDATAFEDAVRTLVSAAADVGLEAAYGWQTWADLFEYTIVSFRDSFAHYDDPGSWMRQFEGTGAESAVRNALAQLEPLDIRVVRREVVEVEPDWSYAPTSEAGQPHGAEIFEIRVSPGKAEAFSQIVQRVIAFYGEIGVPHETVGYRRHFGPTDRVALVASFDDMSAYVGDESVRALAASLGRSDEWTNLLAELRGVLDKVDRQFVSYRDDLSYPSGSTAGSAPGGS